MKLKEEIKILNKEIDECEEINNCNECDNSSCPNKCTKEVTNDEM